MMMFMNCEAIKAADLLAANLVEIETLKMRFHFQNISSLDEKFLPCHRDLTPSNVRLILFCIFSSMNVSMLICLSSLCLCNLHYTSFEYFSVQV